MGKPKLYQKKCRECDKEFFGIKKRVLCSLKCVGLEQKERLVAGNKSRRKYEYIIGLSKQQIFAKNNPEKIIGEYNRDKGMRLNVLMFLGAKCVHCGYEKDVRALELDHIYSDGYLERKKKTMKSKIYRYYSKNLSEVKDRLQVLCSNCNKIKQIENKEFALSKKKGK